MENKFCLRNENGDVYDVIFDQTMIKDFKKTELENQKKITELIYSGFSDDEVYGALFCGYTKLNDYLDNYTKKNFISQVPSMWNGSISNSRIDQSYIMKCEDNPDQYENEQLSKYFDSYDKEVAFRFRDKNGYQYYIIRSKMQKLYCESSHVEADIILRTTENIFIFEKFKGEYLPLIVDSGLDYTFLNQICSLGKLVATSTESAEFYKHFYNQKKEENEKYIEHKIESMPAFVRVLTK